ncbi:MAG TPA: hypothetical protein VKX46_05060 [Ktedonobacteraceae bacterium]|nr:hypothetical protein [Ktedonobacteraceae bacterium]
MPFRFIIVGNAEDPDEAVENIFDMGLPIENARTREGQFAVETQEIDGWRNQNTADLNQMQLDGKVKDWGRYTDLKGDRIMQYGGNE